MTKSINLNGREIFYNLEIKDVKNINIRIKPDQTVFVSANSTVPQADIEDLLLNKADYIIRALDHYSELEKYAPKPKAYVDGESFNVLGHEYRLKVIESEKKSVNIEGAFIVLAVNDVNNYEQKKRTMSKWLNETCRTTIQSVCADVYPKFKKYGVKYPQLIFRNMISRWGSCQPKRSTLTFNYALVEMPIACIEYVVTHEFVHFIQPNHSKKFYNQLSMFMPDWPARKNMLETQLRSL